MGDRLRAPFPWAGGKGRWANDINARLGVDGVSTYNEPFAGSLAVLLSRPAAQREVVCDTSGLLVNAWRSIVHDPQAVAYWGDWPTLHDCLIARRRWLGQWVREHSAKLQADPDYYDAKAGGWWAWCMSHAIRGNADMGLTSRPAVQMSPGGFGIQAHTRRGGGEASVPRMAGQSTGAGSLSAQRGKRRPGGGPAMKSVPNMQREGGLAATAGGVDTRRPGLGSPYSGGQSLQAHRVGAAGAQPTSDRWGPWMDALCARLKQVVILNRPWQSACTPAALAAHAGGIVAVLLDPPYITAGRTKIYEQDGDADAVNQTAQESYEWALAHGDEYRIAYCHTHGSFEFPADWEILTRKYTGMNRDERTEDAVAFSPRCLRPGRDKGQLGLFGDGE